MPGIAPRGLAMARAEVATERELRGLCSRGAGFREASGEEGLDMVYEETEGAVHVVCSVTESSTHRILETNGKDMSYVAKAQRRFGEHCG